MQRRPTDQEERFTRRLHRAGRVGTACSDLDDGPCGGYGPNPHRHGHGATARAVLEDFDEAGDGTGVGAVIDHAPLPAVPVKDVHLQLLLQNLIGNALKYRKEEEPPRVRIEAARENGHWRFSVADNGIGIAPEYQDKVFGIFKRLHPRGGKYSGTGIGLAICQKIVERYGGRIWLQSKPGEGATFHFTVPAAGESKS